jgi:hypothetical protein
MFVTQGSHNKIMTIASDASTDCGEYSKIIWQSFEIFRIFIGIPTNSSPYLKLSNTFAQSVMMISSRLPYLDYFPN